MRFSNVFKPSRFRSRIISFWDVLSHSSRSRELFQVLIGIGISFHCPMQPLYDIHIYIYSISSTVTAIGPLRSEVTLLAAASDTFAQRNTMLVCKGRCVHWSLAKWELRPLGQQARVELMMFHETWWVPAGRIAFPSFFNVFYIVIRSPTVGVWFLWRIRVDFQP